MTAWFRRFSQQGPTAAAVFGPLEWRVLEALWQRETPAAVRDLQAAFPDAAYTTLMTTLDRLHRKGVLAREKQGRAFFYTPLQTRAELESTVAAEALRSAIATDDFSLRPLMSCLVDAVGERDERLLEELEALIRARRAELEGRR